MHEKHGENIKGFLAVHLKLVNGLLDSILLVLFASFCQCLLVQGSNLHQMHRIFSISLFLLAHQKRTLRTQFSRPEKCKNSFCVRAWHVDIQQSEEEEKKATKRIISELLHSKMNKCSDKCGVNKRAANFIFSVAFLFYSFAGQVNRIKLIIR